MGVGHAFVQGGHRLRRAGVPLGVALAVIAALGVLAPLPFAAALGPTTLGAAASLAAAASGLAVSTWTALAAHAAFLLLLRGAVLHSLVHAGSLRAFVGVALRTSGRLFRLCAFIAAVPVALALFGMLPRDPVWLSVALAIGIAATPIVEWAEVRLIAEDRLSALGALLAGYRFLRAHPVALGVQIVGVAAPLALVAAGPRVAALAPGSPAAHLLWLLLLAALHVLRAGAQVALFEDRLGAERSAGHARR